MSDRDPRSRAGRFVRQPSGYTAFEPSSLNPPPKINFDGELPLLLSEADRALGRLDGVIGILPNPDLFLAMYVRREAILSSEIEGTYASLTDVLQFELREPADERSEHLVDVEEVVNYVAAMNHGLKRLPELPLSLRLVGELHAKLLAGVRGKEKAPGEFRRSQNWIGGRSPADAAYVPPPPHLVLTAMGDLEKFFYERSLPALIHAAIAHAQFETIHPFLDGNGRIGRLLITFLLCERKVLSRPLLYLSLYLNANKVEYCDRLQAVRTEGKWEDWLAFFLRGVRDVAHAANETARKIISLREKHRGMLGQQGRASANLQRALDSLFVQPMLTPQSLASSLDLAYETTNKLITRLVELNILQETTGYRRNRRFSYRPYLDLFEDEDMTPGTVARDADADTSTYYDPAIAVTEELREWVHEAVARRGAAETEERMLRMLRSMSEEERNALLATLTPQEEAALRMRFGLGGGALRQRSSGSPPR